MHPTNKRERRSINKVKTFGTRTPDRSGHIRRRIARETQTVKELDHELKELQVLQGSEETSEPVA
jgi:hypothetical protein